MQPAKCRLFVGGAGYVWRMRGRLVRIICAFPACIYGWLMYFLLLLLKQAAEISVAMDGSRLPDHLLRNAGNSCDGGSGEGIKNRSICGYSLDGYLVFVYKRTAEPSH